MKNAIDVDKRAKLLDISLFHEDESWNIELQWTDAEKEELGIKKKDNLMSIDQFNTYISELIDDIKDYQGALKCIE